MEMSLKNVLTDAFWIMPATPKYKSQGLPYITSKNIKNRRIDFNDVKYIDEASKSNVDLSSTEIILYPESFNALLIVAIEKSTANSLSNVTITKSSIACTT